MAAVVAQLVERLILTLEICGSNPKSTKFYLPNVNFKSKDEIEEKEARLWPILKKLNASTATCIEGHE